VAPLVVAPVSDAAEREAEAVAARVLAGVGFALPPISPAPPGVQRACEACAREEERLDRAAVSGSAQAQRVAPPAVHAALATPGHGLDQPMAAHARHAFGESVAGVRIHRGAVADRAARSVGARAFTVGRDIVFAEGNYAPATPRGQALLMHELVHVAQQARGRRRVQRACTHDGTPVNCHNWVNLLPPWIAGSAAHTQIATLLGIPPMAIPRATKVFMGMPTFRMVPLGFADLWSNDPASVGIAEIKSTARGSGVAALEAAHYITRHDESMARGAVATDDRAYHAAVGGAIKPGRALDLSRLTSTGRSLGPFIADPLKQLWIEADNLGAVVYWCTGVGTLNPAWLVALQRALRALRQQLARLREMMEELVDAIVAGGLAALRWIAGLIGDIVEWGAEHPVLAFVALLIIALVGLVIAVLAGVVELPSLGSSTPALLAGLGVTASAIAGILLLLGISAPDLPEATLAAARAVHPEAADATVTGESYDPPGDWNPASFRPAVASAAPDPGARLLAALAPLGNPEAIASAAIGVARGGGISEARARAALADSLVALRGAGDEATARAIEDRMRSLGAA
jgi:hypothetical protein